MNSNGIDSRERVFGIPTGGAGGGGGGPRSVLTAYLLWLLPGMSHYYLRNRRQGDVQIGLMVATLPVTFVLFLLADAIGCVSMDGSCGSAAGAVGEVLVLIAFVNLVTFSGLLPWKLVDLFMHYRDVGKLNRGAAGGGHGGE